MRPPVSIGRALETVALTAVSHRRCRTDSAGEPAGYLCRKPPRRDWLSRPAFATVQVRRGGSGEAVRGVQEEFQFRNLSGDPSQGVQIDGIFGAKTDEAVRGFQQALGLSVDGIAG